MSTEVIDKKEKLLCEYLICDVAAFAKCIRITKPSYFDAPLDRVVGYVIKHYDSHHKIPSTRIIEAETGVKLDSQTMEDESYFLEEYEKFCREQAMIEAVNQSVDHIRDGTIEEITDLVRKALLIRMDNNVGTNLFDDPEARIEGMDVSVEEISCGIPAIDRLVGNIRRGELGMFFAETGGGKSVMLGNIGRNLSALGLDVFIVTLELNEALYSKRLDTIFSGVDISKHKENAPTISNALKRLRVNDGYGNVVTKKMPFRTTASSIRGAVVEYTLMYGKSPDVLIVDYLGLMGVPGNANRGKFEEDEEKVFELREILADYGMYGFSAGQLNRDGYAVTDIRPNHIAGGISVINACDWGVGLVATEEDINNSQVQGVQMKIRNGAKTRQPVTLYRCETTLRINDTPFGGKMKRPGLSSLSTGQTNDNKPSAPRGIKDSLSLRPPKRR